MGRRVYVMTAVIGLILAGTPSVAGMIPANASVSLALPGATVPHVLRQASPLVPSHPRALTTGTSFGSTTTLVTHPIYGSHGTFFLWGNSVCGNGCGPATLVTVQNDGIWDPGHTQKYCGAFYGQVGTYVDFWGARVFAVNKEAIFSTLVDTLSQLPSCGPTIRTTTGPFYGSKLTSFADVNGDGYIDAIAVNADRVYVKLGRADGTFGPTQSFTTGPFFGSIGTFFADVNGDHKDDAIAVNASGTTVRLSEGSAFGPNGPTNTTLVDSAARLSFGDVTGDYKADAVRFANSRVYVYPSNGTGAAFGTAQAWTSSPFYGKYASFVTAYSGGQTDPLQWIAAVFNADGIYAKFVN
jgi:hypothetical protein